MNLFSFPFYFTGIADEADVERGDAFIRVAAGVIVAVEADQPDANSPRYNLGGQRIGNSYRGIVIQNGRKKVVK